MSIYFLQWSSPEDLIKSHLQGKMKLAPPQIYEICKLLNFQNFEELHNSTLERRNKRVKRIFPIPILCDDGIFVVYPGKFIIHCIGLHCQFKFIDHCL